MGCTSISQPVGGLAPGVLKAGLLVFLVAGSIALKPPAARAAPVDADPADVRAKTSLVAALAIDDLYRIEAGQIAFRRAATPEMKAAAQSAIEAARESYQALQNPALAAGVPLPTSVDQQRRQWLDALRAAPPAEFHALLVKQQVAGARQALELAEAYSQSGQGFYLKEYLGRETPRLRQRLEHISAAGP